MAKCNRCKTLAGHLVEFGVKIGFLTPEKAEQLLKEHPQIIRCKDCKWYDERISICDDCGLPREQTFFCADGKRKVDELK